MSVRPTLLLSLVLVVSTGFSCQKKEEKKPFWDPARVEIIIIEVTDVSGGMTWPVEVKEALEKLPNIHEARVLFPRREVRIVIDKDSYDEAQIRAALQKAGFGLGDRLN
jgi:hypothetical protein